MKTNLLIRISCCIWLLFCHLQGFSQVLFQKKEVLQIKIESNLKVLLKDRGETPQYHWGKLSYVDEYNDTISLPIKVKVRGNFRRSSTNCKFPPLLVNFPNKKGKKTVFEHQDKLKLVTECAREDYVFSEYLVYEAYNLITGLSFKARLAQVTYVDSLGKRKPEVAYGFFIENETYVAKRNAAKNYYNKNLSMSLLDSVTMATVSLFEYMIGNNDWSVPALHNIKEFPSFGKHFYIV